MQNLEIPFYYQALKTQSFKIVVGGCLRVFSSIYESTYTSILGFHLQNLTIILLHTDTKYNIIYPFINVRNKYV